MNALASFDPPNERDALRGRLRDAGKRFGQHVVLDHFNLDLHAGDFVALLGTSGSGKTTLLRILAGLEPLDEGEVLVPAAKSVVFQEPRLIPSKRVIDNVLIGLPKTRENRARGVAALAEVGLERHADGWTGTLSGGEAQRVALARALLREPRLLLLDEPFAALDAVTRLKMQALVADLCARHRPTVLLVTHDVEEAILLADRIVLLEQGRISLDLPVTIARPRRRAGAQFDELRAGLLVALGVPELTG
ncbi:ABC transporter ATP-binding protein [Sphingomonas crusticola]|uniref:ABC transporter ATP-binding protein n=1 Tax=Sphingomonas crusticola TaxID=1697973 RepID=UPI000E25BC46|nr:ABC transporter ATP-binding protein [Sphingomonas crusticola]